MTTQNQIWQSNKTGRLFAVCVNAAGIIEHALPIYAAQITSALAGFEHTDLTSALAESLFDDPTNYVILSRESADAVAADASALDHPYPARS